MGSVLPFGPVNTAVMFPFDSEVLRGLVLMVIEIVANEEKYVVIGASEKRRKLKKKSHLRTQNPTMGDQVPSAWQFIVGGLEVEYPE